MPDAGQLLHSNLHEVFAERDPARRWAAIERTYNEDVTFVDPDGEYVGWQALNDKAQELLEGPLAGFVYEEGVPVSPTMAIGWPAVTVMPAAMPFTMPSRWQYRVTTPPP